MTTQTTCPTCHHPLAGRRSNPFMPPDEPRSGTVNRCRVCGQLWGAVAFPPRHPQAPPWFIALLDALEVPLD